MSNNRWFAPHIHFSIETWKITLTFILILILGVRNINSLYTDSNSHWKNIKNKHRNLKKTKTVTVISVMKHHEVWKVSEQPLINTYWEWSRSPPSWGRHTGKQSVLRPGYQEMPGTLPQQPVYGQSMEFSKKHTNNLSREQNKLLLSKV